MRSGFITNASGRLWNPGLFGRMWSVTSSSQLFNNVANGVAYNLDVNDTTIRAVGGNARYYSFPLRWLGNGGGNRSNVDMDRLMDRCL